VIIFSRYHVQYNIQYSNPLPIGIGAIYYVSLIKRRVSDTSTLYMDVEPGNIFNLVGLQITFCTFDRSLNALFNLFYSCLFFGYKFYISPWSYNS
jgi:hypothetical protein